MAEFNEYHLDPAQFPFLKHLQGQWQAIRDEFTHFMHNASPEELKFTYDVMGPKSKTIKTKGNSKYRAFGALFQGLFIEQYIQIHQIAYPDYQTHQAVALVLDHSYPHCPHNYTNYDRTVLVVDFFKTDQPRADVVQFEQELVTQRMSENPYSLGVFGKSDQASEEDFIKYGLSRHQLGWDKQLG
ncbi:MAG: hypothetical protein ACP5RH_19090 [Leptodesmis sp.]|uniref:hypothetical protein n=1 Tax=Leptodesmis sp. TaxID=3100501 RepID=UPI003D0D918F